MVVYPKPRLKSIQTGGFSAQTPDEKDPAFCDGVPKDRQVHQFSMENATGKRAEAEKNNGKFSTGFHIRQNVIGGIFKKM
jgi:hypothetical protein